MFLFSWSKHAWLHLAILIGSAAYLYSRYMRSRKSQSFTDEMAVVEAWSRIIELPPMQFKKIVVGINCNVDVIVPGTAFLSRLNITPTGSVQDHKQVDDFQQLQETFAHFFGSGAPAERYYSDKSSFDVALKVAEDMLQRELAIGGNAALMATKIAATYPNYNVVLVGPIGPRSKALLHPRIVTQNSTRIGKDELHVIMEYRQGEIWGDYVAPTSSRFITSHDMFRAILSGAGMASDLVILSGLHLLDNQPRELWEEKLRQLRRYIGQLSSHIPMHLEMASISDHLYARNLMSRILPYVDSLGLNEQELAFLAQVGGALSAEKLFPVTAGTIHVHKAVEILYWLLSNYGYDRDDPVKSGNRLQRIHFHCLTYHLLAVRGADWSNLAASLAAGARVAARQACGNAARIESDMVDIRIGYTFVLDKEIGRVYRFNPHSPLTSWMRNDVVFVFTPALVCKHPSKTVGIGDAISSVGLVYSQFYRVQGARRTPEVPPT